MRNTDYFTENLVNLCSTTNKQMDKKLLIFI